MEEAVYQSSILEIPKMLKRVNHTFIPYKDYLVIFGGMYYSNIEDLFGSSMTYSDDIIIVNLKTRICQKAEIKCTAPPIPRRGHSACLYKNNKIIVYGGAQDFKLNLKRLFINEVGVISLDEIDANSVEWKVVKDKDLIQRAYHTSEIYEDNMYIFGGYCEQQVDLPSNHLLRLDLTTYEVIVCKTSGAIPRARISHCSVMYKNKYYIFGGMQPSFGNLNDLDFIDLATYKWEKVSPMSAFSPPPISAIDAQLINSKIYIFGGVTDSLKELGDLIAYDIENNQWETINIGGSVRQTSGCKLAYHNDHLLIFGGFHSPLIQAVFIKQDNTKVTGQILPRDNLSHGNKKRNILNGVDDDYVRYLRQLFLNPSFSDITFIVQSQEFFAHKNILAARCKYFENMFSSGMVEAHSSKIHISDVSLESFKALLEFIYCNEFRADEDMALDLLELCDKYSFSELMHACEEFLTGKLTLHNIEKIANISEKFEASILRNSVKEFIIKNISQIQQKKTLGPLPVKLLWEAIFKLASKKS